MPSEPVAIVIYHRTTVWIYSVNTFMMTATNFLINHLH
jgi:hypothetical protein